MQQLETYALSLKQVASALNISRTTLHRQIQLGAIQSFRVGGRVLITPTAIANYISNLEAEQTIKVKS